MTALFEYLHTIQSVWVDNLEYQVKDGWVWLDPVLTLVRDSFICPNFFCDFILRQTTPK